MRRSREIWREGMTKIHTELPVFYCEGNDGIKKRHFGVFFLSKEWKGQVAKEEVPATQSRWKSRILHFLWVLKGFFHPIFVNETLLKKTVCFKVRFTARIRVNFGND